MQKSQLLFPNVFQNMDSQSSCTSSVPNELIVHDDHMFIDELETVNTLHFGMSKFRMMKVKVQVHHIMMAT